MKNAHFSTLFVLFSLVACGSNRDANRSPSASALSSSADISGETNATITGVTTSNTAQSATIDSNVPPLNVNVNDTPSSIPTPTPISSPVPSPNAQIAPKASDPDPYVGTYAAIINAPQYADHCAGACPATIDVNALTVTHDNDTYQINGITASSLAGGGLDVSVTGPGTLFNCSNVTVDDEYGIQNEPNGTTYELITHTTAGDCHGGVHYECQCQYAAQVR